MAPTGTPLTERMSAANGRSDERSHIAYMFPNSTIQFDPNLPSFAITVKPMSRSKTYYMDDIDRFIKKHIHPYFDILETRYEVDNRCVLHAHLLANGGPNMFNHKKIRYWSQDIRELDPDDVTRWVSYIRKKSWNQDTQEEVLWQHIASTECLFD